MTVTVVLPTITCDSLFNTAVESVLTDLGDNRLLVVLDDPNAGDSSLLGDPRIKVVRHKFRMGLAASLNEAIESTDSEYIARMDADDVWLPGRLVSQVSCLDDNPDVVAVGGRAIRVSLAGDLLSEIDVPVGHSLRRILLVRNVLVHPATMFRREAAVTCGGYMSHLRRAEDYEFWLRMAKMGEIANVDRAVLKYRVHPGQMSRSDRAFSRHSLEILRARTSLRRFLGASRVRQLGNDGAWFGAQVLRQFGIRRPHEG